MANEKPRIYHVGLCLLKLFMCFEVVLCHCCSVGTHPTWTNPFYAIKYTAVPVFMVITFALSGDLFINSDIKRLQKRIHRLVLSLIAWSAIYFGAYAFIDMLAGTNHIQGVQDFIWQAATGHRENLNPTMWFHFDLLVLSLIAFACFRYIGGSKRLVCLIASIMIIMGVTMQYTGWNYDLFGNLRYELKYPLGRLFETLPYAGIGLILACLLPSRNPNIAPIFPWKYSRMTVIGIGVASFCVGCLPWPEVAEGFYYGGFRLMWFSMALYCIFNAIHAAHIPESLTRLTVFLSRYALGVYCIHRLVGSVLSCGLAKMDILVSQNFTFACCVFVLSLAACILISMLPVRVFRQVVT